MFEDVGALYFTRAKSAGYVSHVARLWGDGHADYIITSRDLKKIVFEFGFGTKDTKQIRKSMGATKCKYGILVAENKLELKDNVVYIPKNIFLLM